MKKKFNKCPIRRYRNRNSQRCVTVRNADGERTVRHRLVGEENVHGMHSLDGRRIIADEHAVRFFFDFHRHCVFTAGGIEDDHLGTALPGVLNITAID